jgi:hypothetical protein
MTVSPDLRLRSSERKPSVKRSAPSRFWASVSMTHPMSQWRRAVCVTSSPGLPRKVAFSILPHTGAATIAWLRPNVQRNQTSFAPKGRVVVNQRVLETAAHAPFVAQLRWQPKFGLKLLNDHGDWGVHHDFRRKHFSKCLGSHIDRFIADLVVQLDLGGDYRT